MEEREKGKKTILIITLLLVIVISSYWLITSLKKLSSPSNSGRTVTPTETEKKDKKEEKEEPKEVDKVKELADKMMIPFTNYNMYVITDNFNNYYFKEDKYTFDTISDFEKVVLAITIYQERKDYPESQTIPTSEIRKIIKEYFGRELPTKLPEKIEMPHNYEIYELKDGKYEFVDELGGFSELVNRIQQKVVNRELTDSELIVSVNYVYIQYAQGTSYNEPEKITSNIYTDFSKNKTLVVGVKYDQESSVVTALLEGNKTNTYQYHFRKIDDNNYVFDRIELIRK